MKTLTEWLMRYKFLELVLLLLCNFLGRNCNLDYI